MTTSVSSPLLGKLTRSDPWVPLLLLALSVVPMVGGIARLMTLSAPTAADERFVASPAPVVLHIVSATIYSVLGALQFSSGFRARWPGWHRSAGKLVALGGLSTALTGLWMTAFYPIPDGLQGPLLRAARLLVGAAMAAAILLALSSILRREVARHEAWMIRAYALGQGAGTQVLALMPWMLLSGESGGPTRDALMILAWALNVLFAEWLIWIRRRHARPSVPKLTVPTSRA